MRNINVHLRYTLTSRQKCLSILLDQPTVYDGHSSAFDNMGKQIASSNNQEAIVIASFDLDKLRATRESEWICRGAPARKPSAYKI